MISFYRLSSFFAVLVVGLWFFAHASSALAASCTYNATSSANVFNNPQNWSCFHVPTSGDSVFIPAGTSTTLTASAAFSALYATGTIRMGGFDLTATSTVVLGTGAIVSSTSGTLTLNEAFGDTTIAAGAMVTSTSGSLIFMGSVSSSGSVGSSAGNMLFNALIQNNGTVDVGSGFATSSATFVNVGTLRNGSGALILAGGDFANYGIYRAQTGTFRFTGMDPQNIYGDGTGDFYNLVLANTSVLIPPEDPEDEEAIIDPYGVILSMNVSSTFFALTSGTFDLAGFHFASTGTFANTGGEILVHDGVLAGPKLLQFTDAIGNHVSSLSNPGSLYVTVSDPIRNLSSTATESVTVTVTGNSASGADQETLDLVETASNSGVYRNSNAINVKYSGVVTVGTGEFEFNADGSASYPYTDIYSSDVTSTSVALVFAGASATGSSSSTPSSGGGGVGGGGSSALPPVVTVYQTLGVNTVALGIPVHALVKLADDGNRLTQEDSAIYYIGTDGQRHAFPNSRVYFSWYTNFSQVQIVSLAQLSNIPLGKNVTYKPGVRMVKFTTDPKVYAIDVGGVLRWITSESVAVSLYGSAWNAMVDDIADTFYVNYTFGPQIDSTTDFSPSTLQASITNVSQGMGL